MLPNWVYELPYAVSRFVNHCLLFFCPECGLSSVDGEYINEWGYYERTVAIRCKCGTKYTHSG